LASGNLDRPASSDMLSPMDASALNDQAQRCRRLADATYNREVSQMLGRMAEECERTARELSRNARA